jgi:hypothetical protein
MEAADAIPAPVLAPDVPVVTTWYPAALAMDHIGREGVPISIIQ